MADKVNPVKKIAALTDGDYTLVDGAAWFGLDVFSIRVRATDEGVAVDIYEDGREDGAALASCYAFTTETTDGAAREDARLAGIAAAVEHDDDARVADARWNCPACYSKTDAPHVGCPDAPVALTPEEETDLRWAAFGAAVAATRAAMRPTKRGKRG